MREAGRFARRNGYGLWSGCITDDEGDTNEQVEPKASMLDSRRKSILPRRGQSRLEQGAIADPASAFGCEPSYPDVCIPPSPPDLDCGDNLSALHYSPTRIDSMEILTASAAKDDEGGPVFQRPLWP